MKKVNPNQSQINNIKNSTGSSVTNNVQVVDPTVAKSIDNSNRQPMSQNQTQQSTSSAGGNNLNSSNQVHKKNSKSQNPNQVFKQIKYNNLKTTNIKKIS